MDLLKLLWLWDLFGDTPINNQDEIESPFLHFDTGTDRFEIWHWFEDQNVNFIIGEYRGLIP